MLTCVVILLISDFLAADDRGEVTFLTLLDPSAAFDIVVDHHILLDRLYHFFSLRDQAQSWITSFISGRTQKVGVRNQYTTFSTVIVALVLPRLDYCNSVLFGLPANLIQRLQSVQNIAARLIFRIRWSEHITPALISLHWLRIPERVFFKLAVMTYRSIHGTSPS